MSGGVPTQTCCLFYPDAGDAADPLVRGCACRGSFGLAHATCLIQMAEVARVPPSGTPRFTPWTFCSTCKQKFTGIVQLRLTIALWVKYARAVETNQDRLLAA